MRLRRNGDHDLYSEWQCTLVLMGDVELARELMAGSDGAFNRFVDVYHGKLYRYVYAMCGNREDAEEVAQETLLRVFQSLTQLREPELFKPWVFRIAKNACLMKRRRSIFAPRAEMSLDDLKPSLRPDNGRALEIADWSRLPDDLAASAELHGALDHAVGTLPDNYRAVFLLRDVEGLSTDETSHALDLSCDTVKQRLHRARLMLRHDLDRYAKELV
jgi:RNA polymerase sigma-70 factor, ECF subfamily